MTEPILAQYTIRSKQEYIFKTNRLVEIVGASAIIADTFDCLFQCARDEGIVCEQTDIPFQRAEVSRRFQEGTLDMVELFSGGGNDTVLYRNRDVCRRVNAAYTRRILEKFPGLLPMYVGVPARLDALGDYRADYDRLMAEANREKSRMCPGRGYEALPFSKMDRTTFQPFSAVSYRGGDRTELSAESIAKRKVGQADKKKTRDESRFLDDLTTERGKESLLAIVHADGNNMGVKIQRKLKDKTDYDYCVNAMRQFTGEINRVFQKGWDNLEACRQELCRSDPKARDSAFVVREIVSDGDDATFICNARYAKQLTEAYLKGVSSYRSDAGESYSACAGICIFHSHYPFARAYALAEQACTSAKGPVHKSAAGGGIPKEQGWLDYHYIHSGVGGDLEELREIHQTDKHMLRPWWVCGERNKSEERRLERLQDLADILTEYEVSRSNLKTLGAVYEADTERGEKALLEWERICYHSRGKRLKLDLSAKMKALYQNPVQMLKALYDLSEVYDLWYGKGAAK